MRTEQEVENALNLYGDTIRRICFVRLRKQADVEDVFQNVFFKYATKEIPFASVDHEKAWLIRVAINECHSLKRRLFQHHISLDDSLYEFGMETKMQHPEVIYALLQLPAHYRDVIYLHYYEGYRFHEIAQLLHKKEATITTWHARAKQQLKDNLGGDEFEEPTH